MRNELMGATKKKKIQINYSSIFSHKDIAGFWLSTWNQSVSAFMITAW